MGRGRSGVPKETARGTALTHILDTNAGIYVIDGRLAVPLPSGRFGASVVTEIELLSKPGMTPQDITTVHAFLVRLSLIDLYPAIREEAARLCRDDRLKLSDAIIVATALIEGATLVTNDLELRRISGLTIHPLQLRP